MRIGRVGMQTGKRKVATGPAAGDGYEIFLQGFNWESCKKDWYKVGCLLQRKLVVVLLGISYVWPQLSVAVRTVYVRDLW